MSCFVVSDPPGAPEITGYKRNQAIRVNDTVSLTCTSEGGNPVAQVAWFRNNAQVDFSYTTRDNHAYNNLIITATRSDNEAEYRCDAWNKVNAQTPLTVTRKLVVHCKYQATLLCVQPCLHCHIFPHWLKRPSSSILPSCWSAFSVDCLLQYQVKPNWLYYTWMLFHGFLPRCLNIP